MANQKIDAIKKNSLHANSPSHSENLLHAALSALSECQKEKRPVIIFLTSQEQLDETYTAIDALRPDDVLLHVWSAWEHSPFSSISSSYTQRVDRLDCLNSLTHHPGASIILCTPEAWIQPTAPVLSWKETHHEIKVGDDIQSLETLRKNLIRLGYVKSELVEEPGQFSTRGEIIDLFIPTETFPLRVELFDTIVETIRNFNPETQRTHKDGDVSLQSIFIPPAEEVLFPWESKEEILEKIKFDCDSRSISRKIRDPIFENIRSGFLPENFRSWIPYVYGSCGYLIDFLEKTSRGFSWISLNSDLFSIQIRQHLESLKREFESKSSIQHHITPDHASLYTINADSFVRVQNVYPSVIQNITLSPIPTRKIQAEELEQWASTDSEIIIGAQGVSTQEHIRFILKEQNFHRMATLIPYEPDHSFEIRYATGKRLILLNSSSITGITSKHRGIGTPGKRSKSKPSLFDDQSSPLTGIQELSAGDYIVHSTHGIGKYIGLETLNRSGIAENEYLLIEYSGGDRLYLPVYRLNAIQKYVGSGTSPGLDRLGTAQFEKAKQKATESAKKIAINLVDLYARRSLLSGPRFLTENDDYFEFCEKFEFQETEGQSKAIHDILQDLSSGKLMDRLICGDVGFGKTEVAIRAAFQAVQSGFQVCVLVPTTLLAFQHEQTFKKRMAEYPITIESISRFKSKKLQNQMIKDLEAGKIDIMIGTHRLLSKDIKFNRLGLLVIDEEHRFGVEHKEKIKALQSNTHTITLSATPIPRTLNMALSGLKEMSLIRTPPQNRQSIRTFVSEKTGELVKTAIENELARGGQVFYLSNRIQGMSAIAQEIQSWVPHAKVAIAHGQMEEDEIEQKMMDFYRGYSQILICTTIIESGIDVPNAGTILIDRADQLGLAQLYQIRGRVGRSHRKAFAYLLVSPDRILTQEAKLRLDVLQRFVELGSGYQIASHDLEIRGGGNLLGAEQSGNILSIGLDLFMDMVSAAIQELRGNPVNLDDRDFQPEIQVPVSCEIPKSFISDPKLRLSFYRKISNSRTESHLESIQSELEERFGSLPDPTHQLLWLIRIRNLAKSAGLESIIIQPKKMVISVKKQSPISIDEVMKLYVGPKNIRDPRISITPDSKINVSVNFTTLQSHLFELRQLLSKIIPKPFEIS